MASLSRSILALFNRFKKILQETRVYASKFKNKLKNKSTSESEPKSKRLLERYEEKLVKYYLKKFPTLFHICYDPVGTHRKARTAFGFLLGSVLGLFLYTFIIKDLQLNPYTSLICGTAFTAGLSLGCALSLHFRCVCLLTIPGFFGRAGRSVLKALVLGYIIAGPVFNLTYNAKEVMRSFACSGQLTFNLTKTKYDLMFRPFHQAVTNMQESAGEIKRTLSSVGEMIEPISREIEDEDELEKLEEENDRLDELQGESDRRSQEIRDKADKEIEQAETEAEYYEAKYREKITARCEQQLSHGSERCRESFGKAYDQCYETVTWIAAWMLCWPMKLTFVCNLVQALGGRKICNPDGKIDVGIGEGYASLLETRDKLNESLKDVKVNVKMSPKQVMVGVSDAARVAAGVMRDFEARKRFFDGLVTFIKRCLSVIFVKILLDASRYQYRYLRDIEHDNVYMTAYFRKIDARRKARGSLTLLPLKKLERTKLIDPYAWEQSRTERRNLFGQTAKLLLEVITASMFVILDRLLFEILDVVRSHARLEITQEGHHDMSLEILGAGVVAKMVRGLVKGFNVKRRIKNFVTNEACLPRASRLPGSILFRIYGSYLAVWLMLLCQAYSQRLRRSISAFFYRKREKRRVLYLYNETLRRRLGFLRFARARVAKLARAHQLEPESRPFLTARLRWPKYFSWLQRFACSRRRCVVCGETEPRSGPEHRLCQTPECFAVYCEECWTDVGQVCLACDRLQDSSAAEETAVETEYDEDDD
ncbi:DC-STAMP domain containing 1 [Nasonia vitripennis]|uniref:DC-STAMP domain-containing protein 1 n=1 Tax=Nasonia vitripennis TaxID=7425 RepID=A0A7M6W8A0_NASVI|nr:DC-STAMP domain containing 1 [Nasonia vitripennis]